MLHAGDLGKVAVQQFRGDDSAALGALSIDDVHRCVHAFVMPLLCQTTRALSSS